MYGPHRGLPKGGACAGSAVILVLNCASYEQECFDLEKQSTSSFQVGMVEGVTKRTLPGMKTHRNLSKSTIPPEFQKNKSYLVYCLELAAFAGSPTDIATLISREESEGDRRMAALRIDKASLDKMKDLENEVDPKK